MKRAIYFLLFLSVCSVTAAAEVVDQSNSPVINPVNQVGGVSAVPLLQEFTPDLTGVDFLRLGFRNFDNFANTVQVDVFAMDAGTHTKVGVSLGTTSANVPANFDSVSGGLIQFDFPITVPLTPGNLYAFEMNRPIQSMNFYYDPTNGYSDGIMIFSFQQPLNDLIFEEGLDVTAAPSAVPEPSSLLLAMLGAGILGCRRRNTSRNRRVAMG